MKHWHDQLEQGEGGAGVSDSHGSIFPHHREHERSPNFHGLRAHRRRMLALLWAERHVARQHSLCGQESTDKCTRLVLRSRHKFAAIQQLEEASDVHRVFTRGGTLREEITHGLEGCDDQLSRRAHKSRAGLLG